MKMNFYKLETRVFYNISNTTKHFLISARIKKKTVNTCELSELSKSQTRTASLMNLL